MAAIAGHQGSITIGAADPFLAVVVNVHEWTGNWTNEFFNRNVFGDSVSGTKIYRGIYTLRGTIRGYLDDTVQLVVADLQPGTTTSTLTLTANTGQTYTGEAFLSNWNPTVQRVGSLNSYSVDFESDGDWTVT